MPFSEFPLDPKLLTTIAAAGFSEPRPVQAAAIPPILAGSDLLVAAKTGSGKTAAFVLPMLQRLIKAPRSQLLILVPTRELAAQVSEVCLKLRGSKLPALRFARLVGGESANTQAVQLKAGPKIVVATPGRLLDHVREGQLDLKKFDHLVLDEADRMLELGFRDQLEAIRGGFAAKPQTVFLSATLPKQIEAMAKVWLKSPLRLDLDEPESAAPEIAQEFIVCGRKERGDLVTKALLAEAGQALVFVRTRNNCEIVAERLNKGGLAVRAIHGEMFQKDRNKALAEFRSGKCRILVATALAARGLDIPGVALVCNYDLPEQPQDYIHQIGRTGRSGRSGRAMSFYDPEDAEEGPRHAAIAAMLEKGRRPD
ncbi:MAG: hypothetical protein RL095_1195 [Verrucomicrobiota bacterium]|jgi:superfamily II DNA/RNA helicase